MKMLLVIRAAWAGSALLTLVGASEPPPPLSSSVVVQSGKPDSVVVDEVPHFIHKSKIVHLIAHI